MENMSVYVAPATAAKLYVNGVFADASGGAVGDVLSPASGTPFGTVALADRSDMANTVDAATAGFAIWRKTPAHDRYNVLRSAATLLRSRADSIAQALTIEQGKPLAEARIECLFTADIIDWCAEEAKRCYGRVIPARNIAQTQVVLREPVGPVAAFTPWNFPILQAARKIAAALAAGCSIVIKGPEETPVSCSELVRTFHDAGLPAGVLNLLFGVPKDISGFLIPHPAIRKVSFTGSTAVGKELAALAGRHMKRVTMELGGHAPVLVFKDANVEAAAAALAASKFRNAGQQCNSPTRFLVQDEVYQKFVDSFVAKARAIRVGDGLNSDSQMGALANERRVHAMEALVSDAVGKGAKVAFGGHRIGNRGFYYSPTVVADVSSEARLMNDEPFGPIAPMQKFTHIDDAIREANRLSFGLTAYAFTSSMKTAATLASDIEVGALWINQPGPPWAGGPLWRRQRFGIRIGRWLRIARALHGPEAGDTAQYLDDIGSVCRVTEISRHHSRREMPGKQSMRVDGTFGRGPA